MSKTVTVASRMHTAIVISEPAPKHPLDGDAPGATKPALHPDAPRKSATINGARHPAALGEVGITRNVDEALFNGFMAANEELKAGGMLYVVSDDEATALASGVVQNGFEPGVAKARADNDAAGISGGSTLTATGPVKAEDMMAHSDTPNDDSPRSDVNPNAPHTALSSTTV